MNHFKGFLQPVEMADQSLGFSEISR